MKIKNTDVSCNLNNVPKIKKRNDNKYEYEEKKLGIGINLLYVSDYYRCRSVWKQRHANFILSWVQGVVEWCEGVG